MENKKFHALLILSVIILFGGHLPGEEKGIKNTVISFIKQDGKRVVFCKESYALLIGCWNYRHWKKFDQDNFENEINSLEQSLINHGFKVFKHINLDSTGLKNVIDNFKKDYGFQEHNRLLIFFSGHGANLEKSPMGYIVPVDAPIPRKDRIGFLQKSYSLEQFKTIAREMLARQVLFVFDSCASGSIFTAKGPQDSTPINVSEEMAYPVRKFFTAGRGKENVPERSLFIPGFIQGIDGAADYTNDGYITGTELMIYIKDYVKKRNQDQHPQSGSIPKPGEPFEGDFVFMKRQKEAPQAHEVDITELKKWSEWLEKFDTNVNKLKNELDPDKYISPKVKISKWKELLNAYSQDDPYSEKDEILRKQVRERIMYWKRVAVQKGAEEHYSNHFGEVINKKAKRIYKNSQGFWEAEFKVGIVMVYVPAGEFIMGQTGEEKKFLIGQIGQDKYRRFYSDEDSAHKLYVDGFWIGKFEVTVGQFEKFVDDTNYKTDTEKRKIGYVYEKGEWKERKNANWRNPYFEQTRNHPVVLVSFKDATAYCNWLSQKTGLKFRIPQEKQWEKAGRGVDGRRYPWGNSSPYTNNKYHANFNPGNLSRDSYKYTAPVGSYLSGASPYGLLDMSGNVWEWCENSRKLGYAAIRGGGWNRSSRNLRCASRVDFHSSGCYNDLGFRVLMTE